METGFYLVERYLPGATGDDAATAAERVAAAAEQMAAEGISVRYLGGTFVPADETCFCEFEAPTREAVEWANDRANVPFARILPAVRLSGRPPEHFKPKEEPCLASSSGRSFPSSLR